MSARARSARTNGSLRGYLLFQNQIFFFFIFFYITWLTGFDRSPSYDQFELLLVIYHQISISGTSIFQTVITRERSKPR